MTKKQFKRLQELENRFHTLNGEELEQFTQEESNELNFLTSLYIEEGYPFEDDLDDDDDEFDDPPIAFDDPPFHTLTIGELFDLSSLHLGEFSLDDDLPDNFVF